MPLNPTLRDVITTSRQHNPDLAQWAARWAKALVAALWLTGSDVDERWQTFAPGGLIDAYGLDDIAANVDGVFTDEDQAIARLCEAFVLDTVDLAHGADVLTRYATLAAGAA